jgi:peptide chain release factor subunit 1
MATSNSVKQHKLRKLISYLSNQHGRGKEFLSLYIPQGSAIDGIVANLKGELDSAETKYENDRNIRNHVQDAFRNVIQYLKIQKEIPQNGLAVFAGTFNEESKESNIEENNPPEPITSYICKVDDQFHLEPLRDMLRNQKVVGLLAVDSKEASFGVLNGERFEFIENITSGIHGKSGKGGSSQRRYERERDMAVTQFFHRVAEHAARAFLKDHEVAALLVGGPGTTKEDFLKGGFLHYELENALLNTVDTQSAGREAVKEVLDKSCEALKNMCTPEERMIVQRLLASIAKDDDLAIYGLDVVLAALKKGEAEVALVADNVDVTQIVAVCKKCGLSKAKTASKETKIQTEQEMKSIPCERCNAVDYVIEEKDIIDVLEDEASRTNARVEVISSESEEKAKLTALRGFAALLRYKPNVAT